MTALPRCVTSASAGPDQSAACGSPTCLQGCVNFVGSPPANLWRLYSGPGTVTFADPSQTNTTAIFKTPGIYTLELSAADGVHAVSYDAVVIAVSQPIALAVSRLGTNLNLAWAGGSPPYVVQWNGSAVAGLWETFLTTNGQSALVPLTAGSGFLRVQGQ